MHSAYTSDCFCNCPDYQLGSLYWSFPFFSHVESPVNVIVITILAFLSASYIYTHKNQYIILHNADLAVL